MKLHFEADLPYQSAAIKAVSDLFHGQEICRTEFTVTVRAARTYDDALAAQGALEGMLATEQGGIGNRLTLLDTEIEGNLRAVQLRNGLPPTSQLSPDFTVEMETGTGKTYVYLRTIFELNRSYAAKGASECAVLNQARTRGGLGLQFVHPDRALHRAWASEIPSLLPTRACSVRARRADPRRRPFRKVGRQGCRVQGPDPEGGHGVFAGYHA